PLVPALALTRLILEPLQLLRRVVQLREPVRHLHPRDVQLEAFGDGRIFGRGFREWRNWLREIGDECWLNEILFRNNLEYLGYVETCYARRYFIGTHFYKVGINTVPAFFNVFIGKP